MADRVLVVEDDPRLRHFITVNLQLDGFEVEGVRSGEEALEVAAHRPPDVVLLDVGLPGIDGLALCRRLRATAATSHIPLIIVSGRAEGAHRIAGLAAGADDYVLKPFDPLELIARVRCILERSRDLRARSPLTGLPGAHRIHHELLHRLAGGEAIGVGYVDINHFKSYNDCYGFARGDDVILLTARLAVAAVDQHAGAAGFAGHVGGDDFVLVTPAREIEAAAATLIADFDAQVPCLYDERERLRGWLEVPDRRGQLHRFPLVSLAVGIATNAQRHCSDHRELLALATEMKKYLKATRPDSAYAIDERREVRAGTAS